MALFPSLGLFLELSWPSSPWAACGSMITGLLVDGSQPSNGDSWSLSVFLLLFPELSSWLLAPTGPLSALSTPTMKPVDRRPGPALITQAHRRFSVRDRPVQHLIESTTFILERLQSIEYLQLLRETAGAAMRLCSPILASASECWNTKHGCMSKYGFEQIYGYGKGLCLIVKREGLHVVRI